MKNKSELIQLIDEGQEFEYLLFCDEPKKDEVDIACLNQWYESPFLEFLTAEHYMMFYKAKLFNDLAIAEEILKTKSPRKVQTLGRKVQNYDDTTWQKFSSNVVIKGNIEKFSANEKIKDFLLSTKDKVLVEASPEDKIWGIGLLKDSPKATKPKKWLGENKLGFALMQVRAKLKEKEDEKQIFKHTQKIKSVDIDNDTLSQEIGDLYYDSLAEFLSALAKKLEEDGHIDKEKGRDKLAFHLYEASKQIQEASSHIDKAWDICAPYVKEWSDKNGTNRSEK